MSGTWSTGRKTRVRYEITSEKQPRDLSQGSWLAGAPTISTRVDVLARERFSSQGKGCCNETLAPPKTAAAICSGGSAAVCLTPSVVSSLATSLGSGERMFENVR